MIYYIYGIRCKTEFFSPHQTIFFPVDGMHAVDGCVLKTGIMHLFNVGLPSGEKWKYVGGSLDDGVFGMIEKYMRQWRMNLPKTDFARKPRAISEIHHWKMRETHVAGVYMIPALFSIPAIWDNMPTMKQNFARSYMQLITGMRLVYNFSHKPLPTVSISFLIINFFSDNLVAY